MSTTVYAVDRNTRHSAVKSASGQVLCAMDVPSDTVTASRLQCAAKCSQSVLCLDFSTKDNNVCEVFDFIPSSYGPVTGCASYRGMSSTTFRLLKVRCRKQFFSWHTACQPSPTKRSSKAFIAKHYQIIT